MKRFFAKGLAALLPLVVTVYVVYAVFGFLYDKVGVPIGEAIKWGAGKLLGWEAGDAEHGWFFAWGAPFLGFAVAIVLTVVVGFFVATFVGKSLFGFFERFLKRLPVIRTIYPYAKQFTDFFFSGDGEKKMDFKNAVAVPFPTQGVYSIGFITGEGMKSLNDATKKHMVCVFVPTAPTPFTGFVIYVPREDVIPLPLSIEEAMRIIITAGVLHPTHQQVPPGLSGIPPTPHPPMPDMIK